MPTTQFPKIPSPPHKPDLQALSTYVGQITNLLAVLSKELDYLLNGSLDVNNIRAHSITADTLNVDELSAISANLGHITAGLIDAVEIYGSYIATGNGTYPRCEQSSTNNLFAAYGTAAKYISISPDTSGQPVINLVSPAVLGQLSLLPLGLFLATAVGFGDITVSSGGTLTLTAQGQTKVDSWGQIFSTGNGQTLQTALNAKANAFSGVSGTVYVSATSGGAATTPITFSNGIRTS